MSEHRRQTLWPAAPRPWYREPWPWILIAIPAVAVIAGLVTLWLAITHPDYTVVDEAEYRQIENEFRAQLPGEASPEEEAAADG